MIQKKNLKLIVLLNCNCAHTKKYYGLGTNIILLELIDKIYTETEL